MSASAVEVGINDFSSAVGEEAGLEGDGLEAVHIDAVELGSEFGECSPEVGGERFVGFGSEAIDFINDTFVVRRDELGSVVEVGFEPVVVSGVVAGGEDDAGVGVEFTDGE